MSTVLCLGTLDEAFVDEVLARKLATLITQSGPLQRARGFSVIELNRLPEARQAYQKALDEDETDQMARNQMLYLDELAGEGPSGRLRFFAKP